ncbi:MAG: ABC transporter substrate-binding protein [Patescibacteria group bacterium]|nr:ABC transporter substrate-binding protein [Patescibacteria group bacterium]
MSTSRKLIWIVVLVAILLILWWLGGGNTQTPPAADIQEPIKVGVLVPLSGPAAYYGDQARIGVELAVGRLDSLYPDLDFSIVYEDSLYNPKTAVEVYAKLREIDGVDAVVTMASHVSLAVQPLAEGDGILQMAIASTAGAYSTPGDLSFRTIPVIKRQTDLLVDYVLSQEYSEIGILNVNNDFGIGGRDAFRSSLQDRGLIEQVVIEENFLTNATDFRTQLTKIKAADPDTLFVIGTATDYSSLLRQASELGLETQFVSVSSTEDPGLIANAGEYAEGVIYTYYPIDQGVKNQLPDGYAAEGYEAVNLVASSFQKCGKDYQCIQNYLTNLDGYDSIFGDLSFDNSGDVDYPFIMKTVRDGQFVRLEE